MELFNIRRWATGSAQAGSCCVYVKPEKIMQHIHSKLFDCWADPVAHLLLLKSSMLQLIIIGPSFGRVSGPVMTLVWFLLILCVQTLQAEYRHTLGCQRPNLLIPTLSTFCSIIIALKAHGPLPTFQSRSRYFEHRFFISPRTSKKPLRHEIKNN